jgi:ParB-like chromosome segregation protein Spo0J
MNRRNWLASVAGLLAFGLTVRPSNKLIVPPQMWVREPHQGCIDVLAESIRHHGLYCPIIVDKENRLISGYYRVLACRQLGMRTIPAHVYDASFSYKELEL